MPTGKSGRSSVCPISKHGEPPSVAAVWRQERDRRRVTVQTPPTSQNQASVKRVFTAQTPPTGWSQIRPQQPIRNKRGG